MNLPPVEARTLQINLRHELVALGWNDRAIARMVTAGTWVRVRHGAYCDAFAWRRLGEAGRHLVRTRAVLTQARTDVVVSHVSALPWYDAPAWGLALGDANVTRRDGRTGRREAGVRQHRGLLAPGDVVDHGGIPVTSPTRTLLEVTTQVGVEAALVAANHLMHAELTTPALLTKRYHADTKPIDRWPRTLATDLVLDLARPAIESVGESRTFYLLWNHHLPLPEPQVKIRDARGDVVATVDFAWPELGVFLEFDGKVKYEKLLEPGQSASDVVVREKRREDLICRLTGWRCIRIVWADLEQPERTAAMINDFLAGRRSAA